MKPHLETPENLDYIQLHPAHLGGMSVSAIDSRVCRNLFSTQEIRDVFTDESYVRCLIEAEAALARAESHVGVIPAQAGRIITEALAKLAIEYVFRQALAKVY